MYTGGWLAKPTNHLESATVSKVAEVSIDILCLRTTVQYFFLGFYTTVDSKLLLAFADLSACLSSLFLINKGQRV